MSWSGLDQVELSVNMIVMYERVELLCDKTHARMYVCIVCGCLDVEHYRING